MSIRLESVTKSFGDSKVLDHISIEFPQGDSVAILGSSGCGKTTLLRVIAGLSSFEKGDLFIDEDHVAEAGVILIPPEKRNIGMVFQDIALWPHLSVKENLAFGLKAHRVKREERDRRINDILKMVEMSDYLNRKPNELSGGQKQRIGIARALVLEPKILLMDEPLSSLDRDLSLSLQDKICELQSELGFTLIYVTHDSTAAKKVAKRILKMDKGRLLR